MRVLILGGGRFMGRSLARRLLTSGAAVTVLNRGTREQVAGVEHLSGDRSAADGLAALAGRRFDAVVDLSSYSAAWTAAAIERFGGTRTHMLFVSSGVVYAPSPELPWRETSPYGPDPYWGTYAIDKLASERMLRAAHESGRLRVTVVRFPFVMGPANYADREAFILSRLDAGAPILLDGGGSAVNQYVHVDDVAEILTAMIERPTRAVGEAFNVACPVAITNLGLVKRFADASGCEARVVPIDLDALGLAAPTIDLTDLTFPFPNRNYVLDTTKLGDVLGLQCGRGLEQIVGDFVAWWQAGGATAPRRYALEDRVLSTHGLA